MMLPIPKGPQYLNFNWKQSSSSRKDGKHCEHDRVALVCIRSCRLLCCLIESSDRKPNFRQHRSTEKRSKRDGLVFRTRDATTPRKHDRQSLDASGYAVAKQWMCMEKETAWARLLHRRRLGWPSASTPRRRRKRPSQSIASLQTTKQRAQPFS